MPVPPILRVRIRRIVWPADFRYSEQTLFDQLPGDFRKSLRGRDAVCFVSTVGNQVQFVFSPTAMLTGRGLDTEALFSARVRLRRGTFNPEMLANYAGDKKLELEGIQRFEERYAQLKKEN